MIHRDILAADPARTAVVFAAILLGSAFLEAEPVCADADARPSRSAAGQPDSEDLDDQFDDLTWRSELPPIHGPYTNRKPGTRSALLEQELREYGPDVTLEDLEALNKKPWYDRPPGELLDEWKNSAGFGPDQSEAQKRMEAGRRYYAQKDYDRAAKEFDAAADNSPDTQLGEDALFYEAESYFFDKKYAKAVKTYEQLLGSYDYTGHLETVLERLHGIGAYWMKEYKRSHIPLGLNLTDPKRPGFDLFGHAKRVLNKVWLQDPTHPLADDSLMIIADAQAERHNYADAAHHYQLVRKQKNSDHMVDACVKELRCRWAMYQGPLYDDSCLEEAAEVAEVALVQFGAQLGARRGEVVALKNEVDRARARRHYEIARYYDERRHYASARLYYQAVREEYPETPAAELASQRLSEIRGFPDTVDRSMWISNLFSPDDDKSSYQR